ncbi:MAG: hypothetical protein GC168_12910 [Candidatus Hydrogenedens sp.]|nr:hypothetical protein [Candidatus Hydrogenedens sp.]
MDSNKLALVLGGLLLAAFIALPLMNNKSAGPAAGGPPPGPPGQHAGPPPGPPPGGALPPPSGPPLTPGDLVNTTWDVPSERGTVRASLYPGGKMSAIPPPSLAGTVRMMTGSDTIQGTWQMNGNRVTVSAKVGPTTQTFNCEVRGQEMYCGGQKAARVQ